MSILCYFHFWTVLQPLPSTTEQSAPQNSAKNPHFRQSKSIRCQPFSSSRRSIMPEGVPHYACDVKLQYGSLVVVVLDISSTTWGPEILNHSFSDSFSHISISFHEICPTDCRNLPVKLMYFCNIYFKALLVPILLHINKT